MKLSSRLLFLTSSLLLAQCLVPSDKINDNEHFYLTFTHELDKLGYETFDEIPENHDNLIKITTHNKENFVCQMPVVDKEDGRQMNNYNGPAPEQILKPLYDEKLCSYLIDVYWSYEVCHGSYVLQYHEENRLGSAIRTEYYLGNLHRDYITEAAKKVDNMNPPKKIIEGEDYPYYTVSYTHGTTCDINGKPRTTDVIYICVENANNKVLSVLEVSSCHYEVIVMTSLLCNHPAYRLTQKKDHQIKCYNMNAKDENTAKPISLQSLDEFHQSTFEREYTISPSKEAYEEEVLVDLEDLKKFQSLQAQMGSYQLAGTRRFQTKETLANNELVVDHTVNYILAGIECIVGGQGWWKYEFCFGKHVLQYHIDKNGEKTEIVLGIFDEAVHKAWVEDSPKTRGPKITDYITQVSNIYVKGDVCEESDAHRSVEVRLRCQHSEFSALAIAMELKEPKTCQYVLTIDSERFCEPLQYADDYGLIALEKVDKAKPGLIGRDEFVEEEEENE